MCFFSIIHIKYYSYSDQRITKLETDFKYTSIFQKKNRMLAKKNGKHPLKSM